MSNELDILGRQSLTEREQTELVNASHSELLAEAFNTLSRELDVNGNSKHFQNLRQEHAEKLLSYWQARRQEYLSKVELGETLVQGDESLTIHHLGVYERDDEQVLMIERRTKTENDEVSVHISTETGLDEFLRPPRIKSEVSTDPEEAYDIVYEVIFRSGKISTFSRTNFRSDPESNHPYIKDTRVIDCSIFGVEVR